MTTQRKVIALSAGGDNDELADQGIGIEHINELMVRFSMRLLRDGNRLSFGGTLGNPDEPLTQTLIDTAITWLDDEIADEADPLDPKSNKKKEDASDTKKTNPSDPKTWPLINYSGWPYFTFVDDKTRASHVGICHFVNVPPENVSSEELKTLKEEWESKPVARRRNADSLTLMRRLSAKEADLRIVWGGKIHGAKGWMAGILEEVAITLEEGKPLLLLGGFGGCAKLIAKFLSDEGERWPSELNLQATSDSERENLLSTIEKKLLRERFDEVKSNLEKFRKKLHSKKLVNGISNEALFQGLTDTSPRQIVRLGSEVARSLAVTKKTKKK